MHINTPIFRNLILNIKKLEINKNALLKKLPGFKTCSNKKRLKEIHDFHSIEPNVCVFYFQIQNEKRKFDTNSFLSTDFMDFNSPFYTFTSENRVFTV